MSHQIVAFMTREFTHSTKQPTRSQEFRSTELMFVLLICHGRQTSERMHPKRVVTVKRVSSVGGVMRYRRGRETVVPTNGCDILFIPSTSAHCAFRRHIRRTIGGNDSCLVVFVGKMHRRASSSYPLPNLYNGRRANLEINEKSNYSGNSKCKLQDKCVDVC